MTNSIWMLYDFDYQDLTCKVRPGDVYVSRSKDPVVIRSISDDRTIETVAVVGLFCWLKTKHQCRNGKCLSVGADELRNSVENIDLDLHCYYDRYTIKLPLLKRLGLWLFKKLNRWC